MKIRGGSRISHWGGANPHWRGCQPPTQVLYCENICKNERIWSCWGGARRKLLYVDPPLKMQNVIFCGDWICFNVCTVEAYRMKHPERPCDLGGDICSLPCDTSRCGSVQKTKWQTQDFLRYIIHS